MFNLSNIDIRKQYGSQEEEIAALKSYIYQLVEEVSFRLDDIDSKEKTIEEGISAELVEEMIEKKTTLDYIHPVGQIFITVDSSFDPNESWGGTWVLLKDVFLIGAGNDYTIGSTGGEATHTLTEAQLPSVTGSFKIRKSAGGVADTAYAVSGKFTKSEVTEDYSSVNVSGGNQTAQQITYAFGSGEAHNNMPPYKAVNMWQRTA